MNCTANRNYRSRRMRGFTLMEILVVIFVILVGIVAVVQLFPPGFLSLQRTQEITEAEALNEQQLNAAKQQNSVIQSIVALDQFGNVDSTVRPDDLTGPDPVNKVTRVIGETFHVPVPTANATSGYGAIYQLQLTPALVDLSKPTSLVVYGVSLQRVEQSSDPSQNPSSDATPRLANESQYTIDYKKNQIGFYPRVGSGQRSFVFHYDYYSTTGPNSVVANKTGAILVADVPLSPVGDTPRPVWQPIFDLVNNVQPADFVQLRTNEDVSRQFKLMSTSTVVDSGNAPAWDTNDAYEYEVYSKQYPGNANAGVLIFNPVGHGQVEQGPGGLQPLTVRVDYTTYDNHVIRDDRTVPNQTPFDVKLTLPGIFVNGDTRYDQTLYQGLFGVDAGNNPTPDLLVYDLNTGQELGSIVNGVAAGIGMMMDAKTGVVRLNSTDVANLKLAGVTLRFLYRAHNEWGVEMLKASLNYQPAATGAFPDYHSYVVGPAGAGSPTRIYFARCDAGKTVVLGEYYMTTAANPRVRVTNETYQIISNSALFDGYNQPYIDITTQHSDATGFAATLGLPEVSNVEGGSIASRAMWRNNGRWRSVDDVTYLTQEQGN